MFVSEIYDEASEILGTTDQSKVFRKLTQAVQALMESGHWYHTNAEVDVCTGWDGQTITLPRGIEVPLAVNIDGSPTYFRGRLFQYHVNAGGMYNPVSWAWDDRGFVATLMDIKQPGQLIAIAESTNDAGKVLRVVGTDAGNRPLRSQLPDGTGVDGLLLPIHSQADYPYGTPIADDLTVKTREVAMSPINTFLSTQTALVAGEAMVFSSLGSNGSTAGQTPTGAFPFLVDGTTYYIGSVTTTSTGATSFQLFNSLSDANAGINPIAIQSFPTGNPNTYVQGSGYINWSPYLPVSNGQNIYWGDRLYFATNDGVLGGSPPTNYSSAQTNGTVNLGWINPGGGNCGVPGSFRLTDTRPVNLLTAVQVTDTRIAALTSESTINEVTFSPFTVWTSGAYATAGERFYYNQYLYFVSGAGIFGVTPPLGPPDSGYTQTQTNGTATITYLSGYPAAVPSPLVTGVTYFAKQLDTTADFQIYGSLSDAENNNNPIYLNGQTENSPSSYYTPVPEFFVNMGLRKAMNPESIFTFSAPHYFSTGDVVEAVTSGTLPQPLLTNVNYFVHVISTTSISIHTNSTDAATGKNPIVVTTTGSGVNSFAKLIPATAVVGSTNQIQASGFNLAATPASGSGAIVNAYPEGGIISVNIVSGGTGYTTPTISFSDVGGYQYTSAPTVTLIPPVGYTGTPATFGSGSVTLQTDSATGYKYISSIVPTTAGTGYSTVNPPIVSITGGGGYGAVATATVNSTGNISAITLQPLGTGAQAAITVGSGVITSIVVQESGTGYIFPPRVTITGSHSTAATAYTLAQYTSVNNYFIQNPGSGYTQVPQVTITGGGGTGATATASINSDGTLAAITPVSLGSGYTSAPTVTITPSTNVFVQFSSTGTLPSPLVSGVPYRAEAPDTATSFTVKNADFSAVNITDTGSGTFYLVISRAFGLSFNSASGTVAGRSVSNTTKWAGDFTGLYNSTNTEPTVVQFGTDYLAPAPLSSGVNYGLFPISNTEAFLFNGTFATATANISSTGISSLTITNPGSGYISNTTSILSGITLTASNLGLLSGGTGYAYASSPYSSVPIVDSTGQGSGALGTVVVNSSGVVQSVNVTTAGTGYTKSSVLTLGTVSGFTTGSGCVITPGAVSLVITGNGTGASYVGFINSIDGSIFSLVKVSAGSGYSGVPTVQISLPPSITVTTLGTGQGYYVVPLVGGVVCLGSQIVPSSTSNLAVGQNVIFTSAGLVPSWMDQTATRTIGNISGGAITLTGTPSGNANELPIGQLYMTVQSDVSIPSLSSIVASESMYETGTEVFVRANTGDSLPKLHSGTVLPSNVPYYIRRLDNNTFELFDTYAHATTPSSITGLQTFSSVGNTVESTFFVDAVVTAVVVKSVQHIDKPLTDGYVSLYAFDRGRTNDMTLIGQYHPSETNPMYRRIKIGQSCAWARILYRVKAPTITSIYDYIPLEQTRAIIAAVHAVDLEDKDFMDQATKYWAMAMSYLKNQQNSMDGHAFNPPQINNITYGDGTDPVIDGCQFYF